MNRYKEGWLDGQRHSDGYTFVQYDKKTNEYDRGYVNGWNLVTQHELEYKQKPASPKTTP